MAIVEFQVAEQPFLELLRTELDRRRLPGPTLPGVAGLQGKLLQRFECINVAVASSGLPGHVDFTTELAVHFNNDLAEVRAAGSMRLPSTHKLVLKPPLTAGIVLQALPGAPDPPFVRITCPVFPYLSGELPFTLPDDLDVQVAALGARQGAVAMRLGTHADDPVTAPVTNELDGAGWRQFVPGGLLADTVTSVLASAVENALSEDVLLDRPARGRWERTGFPHAAATATIRVVTPLIDVLVDLRLALWPEVVDRSLRLTATLSWVPRTNLDLLIAVLVPYFGPKLMRDLFNAQFHRMLPGEVAGEGFEEVRRDDSSITFQRMATIVAPSHHFTFGGAEVTPDGIVSSGEVRIRRPRRGLEGSVTKASYDLDIDCGARRVGVVFTPPRVLLRDLGSDGGAPQLFDDRVVFDPPGAWLVETVPHSSWYEAALTFRDPPGGRLPAATATSAYLHTDCGVVWADLGRIPAKRADPGSTDIAQMLSNCMAISDRWGMGVLNLGWLIDPPDVLHPDELLRDWEINVAQIPPDAVIEVVASGPDGDRVVAVISGHGDALVHVVTGPNETLELRTREDLGAPMPVVTQRWVEPSVSIAVEVKPEVVAAVDDLLGVRDEAGRTVLIDVASNGSRRLRQPAATDLSAGTLQRLAGALERQQLRTDGIQAAVTTDLSRETVVIARDDTIILGTVHGHARL